MADWIHNTAEMTKAAKFWMQWTTCKIFLNFFKEAASCRLKQKFFSCKLPLISLALGYRSVYLWTKNTFDCKPPLPLLDISTSLAFLVLVISRKPCCCKLDIIILIKEAKTNFKEIKVWTSFLLCSSFVCVVSFFCSKCIEISLIY